MTSLEQLAQQLYVAAVSAPGFEAGHYECKQAAERAFEQAGIFVEVQKLERPPTGPAPRPISTGVPGPGVSR